MTTAERVLDIARQEIGTREAPNGSNPYGRAYGVDRVAWCMQFVWWCFRQAGAGGLIHPKTAYTPTAYDWHRARGQVSTTPRVGSLVFFDWPDSVRRIQHVGLVEAVEPTAIVTIEGNTSTSNQSDGGGVMRRRRARNASIVGYGHPAYASPTPTPRPRPEDPLMALSDAEQRELLDHTRALTRWLAPTEFVPPGGDPARPWSVTTGQAAANVYVATFYGGPSTNGRSLFQAIADAAVDAPDGPAALTAADHDAIARRVIALLTEHPLAPKGT